MFQKCVGASASCVRIGLLQHCNGSGTQTPYTRIAETEEEEGEISRERERDNISLPVCKAWYQCMCRSNLAQTFHSPLQSYRCTCLAQLSQHNVRNMSDINSWKPTLRELWSFQPPQKTMSCPRVPHFVCTCHRAQHYFSVHVLWFSISICIAMRPALHTSSGSAFLSRISSGSTFISHISSFAQFLWFRNCAHNSSFAHVVRTSGSALLYHIASGSIFLFRTFPRSHMFWGSAFRPYLSSGSAFLSPSSSASAFVSYTSKASVFV